MHKISSTRNLHPLVAICSFNYPSIVPSIITMDMREEDVSLYVDIGQIDSTYHVQTVKQSMEFVCNRGERSRVAEWQNFHMTEVGSSTK